MAQIQLDLPDNISRWLGIEKLKRHLKTKQEALIQILGELVEKEERR